MSKIICMLENASDLINGIKFGPVEGVEGLVSEEVSESVASIFLSIPGYVLHGADGEDGGDKTGDDDNTPPAPKPETAAERKARLKREAAEKEAAEKAEAERLAAEEEAARVAAEEEAARKAAEDAANAGTGEGEGNGEGNEVF